MNDAYAVRIGLLGIELATIDVARVGAARVDPYQQYAEAVNRLDLQPEAEAEGTPRAGIEGTATTVTVIEGELDHSRAERVEQLVEKVTGGWDVEKVTGGWGFAKVTGGGDKDEDRAVPASRWVPSRR